jgi:hypothetical protein
MTLVVRIQTQPPFFICKIKTTYKNLNKVFPGNMQLKLRCVTHKIASRSFLAVRNNDAGGCSVTACLHKAKMFYFAPSHEKIHPPFNALRAPGSKITNAR